jgi:hypothetical protein
MVCNGVIDVVIAYVVQIGRRAVCMRVVKGDGCGGVEGVEEDHIGGDKRGILRVRNQRES